MGKSQRRKGGDGERAIVNILKEHEVPAKRISMQETGGIDKGDIEVAGCWKGQVKVGKQVPDFDYKAMEDGSVFLFKKKDRKKWLVTMTLDFFLERFL